MSEKPLLLPSAKSGIMVRHPRATWLRTGAVVVGIVVVLIGAADITTRVANATLGESTNMLAFGPAAALETPPTQAASQPAPFAGVVVPARLRVPSLGIDAAVEEVATKADGSMGTPENFKNVGWYAPGSKPGEEGNAVFAGHVNNARTTAGVFAHLEQIEKGDYITVSDAESRTKVYLVESVQTYRTEEAPLEDIFSQSGPSKLVLITCEGEWLPSERTFDKRLVVVARLAY